MRHTWIDQLESRRLCSAGDVLWSRQFGVAGNDSLQDEAIDTAGNIYVAGHTDGSLGTSGNAFIRKYTSAGAISWTKTFGATVNDIVIGLGLDSVGNIYAAGNTNGEGFLKKFNSAGTQQWSSRIASGAGDTVADVAVDSTGNAYVAGYTRGKLGGTYSGLTDAYIFKFNSAGVGQWVQQFGTSDDDRIAHIGLDPQGNFWVTGTTFGSLLGTFTGPTADGFIAKFSSAGIYAWGNQTPAVAYVGMAFDSTSNAYVAIQSGVRKFSSAGATLWTRNVGTNESTRDVAVDAQGNYIVGLIVNLRIGTTNVAQSDVIVRKYAPAGTTTWSHTLSSPDNDSVARVALAPGGDIVAAGVTTGSLFTTNPSSNQLDAFVARISGGTTTTFSVTGTIYTDANDDGIRQTSEVVRASASIFLDLNNNGVHDSTEPTSTTTAAGAFSFTGIAPGTYAIRLTSTGRVTQPVAGYDTVTVASASITGRLIGVTDRARIGGTIYNDVNGDGIVSTGDVGRASVGVFLDTDNDGVFDTGETKVTTDSTGNYIFKNLAPGTYHVRPVPTTGWRQTTPTGNASLTVALTAAQILTGKNLLTTQRATVSGTVFNDLNHNGLRETSESLLSGFIVYIDANNNGKYDTGEASVTTGSTGAWAFTLPAGTFRIRIKSPTTAWSVVSPTGGVFTLTLTSAQVLTGKTFAMRT